MHYWVHRAKYVNVVHFRYPRGEYTQRFSASEHPASNFFTSCSGSFLVMASKDHFSPWRSMKQNWIKSLVSCDWTRLNISCRSSLPRSLLILKGINDAFVATRLKSFELPGPPVFRFSPFEATTFSQANLSNFHCSYYHVTAWAISKSLIFGWVKQAHIYIHIRTRIHTCLGNAHARSPRNPERHLRHAGDTSCTSCNILQQLTAFNQNASSVISLI